MIGLKRFSKAFNLASYSVVSASGLAESHYSVYLTFSPTVDFSEASILSLSF